MKLTVFGVRPHLSHFWCACGLLNLFLLLFFYTKASTRTSKRFEHLYKVSFDNVTAYLQKKQQRLEEQQVKRRMAQKPHSNKKAKKETSEAVTQPSAWTDTLNRALLFPLCLMFWMVNMSWMCAEYVLRHTACADGFLCLAQISGWFWKINVTANNKLCLLFPSSSLNETCCLWMCTTCPLLTYTATPSLPDFLCATSHFVTCFCLEHIIDAACLDILQIQAWPSLFCMGNIQRQSDKTVYPRNIQYAE